MFTIIGADGKEYGPVPADKLREWIATGRANAQTQCRREGDPAWSTLGSLPEFSASFSATPPPVSGTARPAVARAPSAPPPDAKAYADEVLASGARVRVFDCLGKGFQTWTTHFLPLMGVTALVMVVVFVVGWIPLIGGLSNLLLTGVFYAGLYYYYLGIIRGEPRELGDAFAGFTRNLGQLILCNLMKSVLLFVLAIIFMAPLLGAMIPLLFSGGNTSEFVFPALAPVAIGSALLGALVMVFVTVSLVFAYPLIIDKNFSAWDALAISWRVVLRNWFPVFVVILFSSFLASLGMVALIIGIFLTLPIFFASLMHAYESLFGRRVTPTALPE